ncbi:MAG: sigma-70 family RNA polymerase sigma factor [Ilumatobacteraceae bacterium]|nr:sigma-70 family RNA polymerase sigma factor [Ilumatobacteraceae bacterium]
MLRDRQPLDDRAFRALIVEARAGDERAIEVLFRDLYPRVLRFARVSEPRAADDIAGEVWLAVARGLRAFDGELVGFRAWVFSIARRRLADHRRTAVRRATDPVAAEFFSAHPAGADTEAEVVDQMTGQAAIDLIARTLPADQAEVLTLRILGDLDVAHVAELMGRDANWVRVTQHRALRRLATALGPAAVADADKNFVDRVLPVESRTI